MTAIFIIMLLSLVAIGLAGVAREARESHRRDYHASTCQTSHGAWEVNALEGEVQQSPNGHRLPLPMDGDG